MIKLKCLPFWFISGDSVVKAHPNILWHAEHVHTWPHCNLYEGQVHILEQLCPKYPAGQSTNFYRSDTTLIDDSHFLGVWIEIKKNAATY